MEIIKNLLIGLKRISFDLVGAVASLFLVLYLVPEQYFSIEAKTAFLSLILTKFILITLGNVHFFITRKLMFKYINFATEKEWSNNAIIIAMYCLTIFCWARGG